MGKGPQEPEACPIEALQRDPVGEEKCQHLLPLSMAALKEPLFISETEFTLCLLSGASHGQGNLVGCRLWGRKVGHD